MGILNIDSQSGCEDTIEVYYREESLYISIENPWSGDTWSGFGSTTNVVLNKEDARLLRNKLNEFLGEE